MYFLTILEGIYAINHENGLGNGLITTPNGRNIAAPAERLLMPSAAWAWDMLRENLDYRHDCIDGLKHSPKMKELESGSRLIIGNRRYEKARKWGLLFFVDPDLGAMEADVFWQPSHYPATVHVRLAAT